MLNSPSDTGPISWFCLRSHVKREHVAAANLHQRVAVEVFAPRIRAPHRSHRGVMINTVEALFPGYLFARFAYPHQLRHVMSTTGVTGIVAFGGRPPAILDDMIARLRHEVSQVDQLPTAPVLKEGAWVRILSGCFRFLEGRVLHFDPRTERVRLLLTLLGSEVQVSLAAGRVALQDEQRPCYPANLLASTEGSVARASCAV